MDAFLEAAAQGRYVINTHRVTTKSVSYIIGGGVDEKHLMRMNSFLDNSEAMNSIFTSFKNNKNEYSSKGLIQRLVDTYEVHGMEAAAATMRSILLSSSLRLLADLAENLEDSYKAAVGPPLLLKESGLRELALLRQQFPVLDFERLFPGEFKSLRRNLAALYSMAADMSTEADARSNPTAGDLMRVRLFAVESMADLEFYCSQLQVCEEFSEELANMN